MNERVWSNRVEWRLLEPTLSFWAFGTMTWTFTGQRVHGSVETILVDHLGYWRSCLEPLHDSLVACHIKSDAQTWFVMVDLNVLDMGDSIIVQCIVDSVCPELVHDWVEKDSSSIVHFAKPCIAFSIPEIKLYVLDRLVSVSNDAIVANVATV